MWWATLFHFRSREGVCDTPLHLFIYCRGKMRLIITPVRLKTMLCGVTKQGGVKLLDSLQGEKMVSELGITRRVESIAIFAARKKNENEKTVDVRYHVDDGGCKPRSGQIATDVGRNHPDGTTKVTGRNCCTSHAEQRLLEFSLLPGRIQAHAEIDDFT